MDIESKQDKNLFGDRGLRNQRSTQTRGRNHSTNLSNEEQLNKNILCDAVSCYSRATQKISLPAGKFGFIDVFVCDKCVGIFTQV